MNLIPVTLADEPNQEVIPENMQYVSALSLIDTPKPIHQYACNCVLYIKQLLHIQESLGMARDIPITTHAPFIGAIVVTYESALGHVAYVQDIDWSHGELILQESNFTHCRITEGRRLSMDSPLIKGYR